MYTVLDTEDLPVEERFAFWLEILAHSVVPFTLRSPHQADFRARARALELGAVRATQLTQPSMEGVRTPKLIRQCDPEYYQLGVNVRGNVEVRQARSSVPLVPGDIVLLDSSQPFHCVAEAGTSRCVGVTLAFPRGMLALPENRVKDLLLVAMSGHKGLGQLLSRYLRQLIMLDGSWRAADASRLATVTLDLLAVMLAQHLEAERLIPEPSRQRALLAQILAFIQQHLSDPDLSPFMIAAAHGISVRTLHRIFVDHESSVTRWIRNCRLDRCRRDLTDPQLQNRPVHAVAARWGLRDAAHFSRAFRATYGLSPQAYRQEYGGPTPIEM